MQIYPGKLGIMGEIQVLSVHYLNIRKVSQSRLNTKGAALKKIF